MTIWTTTRRRRTDRRTNAAFTMVEMLVALGATMILAIFLNQIFTSMSAGVSAGAATSQIIETNVPMIRRITEDMNGIASPSQGGFLVIVQQVYRGVQLTKDDLTPHDIRSDQVVWIKKGATMSLQTPSDWDRFEPFDTQAKEARVWYGHVLQTGEDGLASGDLSDPGPNEFAANWVLGRQVMVLDGSGTPAHYIRADYTVPDDEPIWSVNWNAADTTVSTRVNHWYMGLSDLFSQDLNWIHTDPNGHFAIRGYPQGAYDFAYAWAGTRLWCNPTPRMNDGNDEYRSWQVAQMHPYLMANVSEFAVDFAGDYESLTAGDPYGIDLFEDKYIRWYGRFYNNNYKTAKHWTGGDYRETEPIIFLPPEYSATNQNGFAHDATMLSLSSLNPNIHPAPIYHDDPVTDGFGALPGHAPTGTPAKLTGGFVWGSAGPPFAPGGSITAWPNMLRFRYRVHDAQGRLADRDGRKGKLFERIIYLKDMPGLSIRGK